MNSNVHLSLRTNGAWLCLKSRFSGKAQRVSHTGRFSKRPFWKRRDQGGTPVPALAPVPTRTQTTPMLGTRAGSSPQCLARWGGAAVSGHLPIALWGRVAPAGTPEPPGHWPGHTRPPQLLPQGNRQNVSQSLFSKRIPNPGPRHLCVLGSQAADF